MFGSGKPRPPRAFGKRVASTDSTFVRREIGRMQAKLAECDRRMVRPGPDADLARAAADIIRARLASLHTQLAEADDARTAAEYQGYGFTMRRSLIIAFALGTAIAIVTTSASDGSTKITRATLGNLTK